MKDIEDIITAATNASEPAANLLRRLLILAHRLKNDDLLAWVTKELNGYGLDDELPPYREVDAYARGNFSGPFGAAVNGFVIPAACLPENVRQYAERAFLRHPIAEIEQLSAVPTESGLQSPWPGNLVAHVGHQILQGYHLLGAHQELSRSDFHGIVDTVRTRVLEFALKLKDATADLPSSEATPSPQAVNQAFHMTIGTVQNLALGNSGTVTQTASMVLPGDLESLRGYLRQLGVPEPALTDLEAAVAKDRAAGPESRSHTYGWLSGLVGSAWGMSAKVSGAIAVDLVAKAIMAFFGAP